MGMTAREIAKEISDQTRNLSQMIEAQMAVLEAAGQDDTDEYDDLAQMQIDLFTPMRRAERVLKRRS